MGPAKCYIITPHRNVHLTRNVDSISTNPLPWPTQCSLTPINTVVNKLPAYGVHKYTMLQPISPFTGQNMSHYDMKMELKCLSNLIDAITTLPWTHVYERNQIDMVQQLMRKTYLKRSLCNCLYLVMTFSGIKMYQGEWYNDHNYHYNANISPYTHLMASYTKTNYSICQA